MQKEHRLAKREDFNRVYRRGKSAANLQFVLYYLPQKESGPFRLGVSVSKKLGNAVVRNGIRRRMKEIIRLGGEDLLPGLDIVIIARKPVAEMDYEEMKKSLYHVMKRSGVLKEKKRNQSSARP
ncbi:ribonuclease P protein component [Gorillibacterium timonense]|uniref:ribonuclease P protein component n=1 Tax=Gorillibacterium timonense TaxID=1689269 RepID=UPI00071D8EE2|nr:ribonuclease P protein component [Gorillibacterium timonense]